MGKEKLKQYIDQAGAKQAPVFEIVMFDKKGQEHYVGYFHKIEHALTAFHTNSFDLSKYGDEGAIRVRFPGITPPIGEDGELRLYWNDAIHGFHEYKEPPSVWGD